MVMAGINIINTNVFTLFALAYFPLTNSHFPEKCDHCCPCKRVTIFEF